MGLKIMVALPLAIKLSSPTLPSLWRGAKPERRGISKPNRSSTWKPIQANAYGVIY
jgi:hypothetical protein